MKRSRSSSEPKLYLNQASKGKKRGENREHNTCVPFVVCGEVFNPVLPTRLRKKDPPVKLAQLTINTEGISDPCILINFSGFVTSILREERLNNLVFRLVRTCQDTHTREVIQEWPFRRELVIDTNIKEPIVFNVCECLHPHNDRCCTYTMELVEAKLSEQSSYDITQKSMTAQVYCGSDKRM